MPFFSENEIPYIFLLLTNQNHIKSLQVPDKSPLKALRPEKRVLPFTSAERRSNASLTIEAAMSLSLFIFMTAVLLEPIKWLDRQRKVQAATESFCEDLSQYAYIALNPEEDINVKAEGEDRSFILKFFTSTSAELWLRGQVVKTVDGKVRDITVRSGRIPDQSGDIHLEVAYREEIPLFPFSVSGVNMQVTTHRRAWTGLDGKLKRDNENVGKSTEDETIVYVGKNMGRYHWSRDCHYLSNDYLAVPSSDAGNLENSSGRKYQPCARCRDKGGKGGAVYVTPEGGHYHFSKSCSAMISYVRSIPLREVEGLGACSYCSRTRGFSNE